MDQFFNQNIETYFKQFHQASDSHGAAELISDSDENIYDRIEERVSEMIRKPEFIDKTIINLPDIAGIIKPLECAVFSKKECPLCKKSMGTRRELRRNQNIESVIHILRPIINLYEDQQFASSSQLKENFLQEMRDLAEIKEKQQMQMSKANKEDEKIESEDLESQDSNFLRNLTERQVGRKRGSKQRQEEEEESDNENGELDIFEIEQRQIRRKVSRLRQGGKGQNNLSVEDSLQEKLMHIAQQNSDLNNKLDELKNHLASPEEIKYYTNYERLKVQLRNDQNFIRRNLKILERLPVLDLKIKILFDEDLKTLAFPSVKEFIFRASSDTTLEIAAKVLSNKNQHPNLWRYYSFSVIRKRKVGEDQYEQYEFEIKNMKKSFGDFKDDIDQNDLVLFYKIECEFESPFVCIQNLRNGNSMIREKE
ncbi:UNKNOWN [Stylonychia lemnae]|uniref:Uncharacterized protein n=1 Tax=Stylonychia lemnae TaxID=5949 RepID=A0A078APX6_STYLE|nr:UNKNOWN [Stylonychia lemnae]|eukprot:CDW83003.1 UNKNOWN [Stylonychia lemnae]